MPRKGIHYFHRAHLKEVDHTKYPKDPSNIIQGSPCKIPTTFFIQGQLLGLRPQITIM